MRVTSFFGLTAMEENARAMNAKRVRLRDDHTVRGYTYWLGGSELQVRFDRPVKLPNGETGFMMFSLDKLELESEPCAQRCSDCLLAQIKRCPPLLACRRIGVFFRWA